MKILFPTLLSVLLLLSSCAKYPVLTKKKLLLDGKKITYRNWVIDYNKQLGRFFITQPNNKLNILLRSTFEKYGNLYFESPQFGGFDFHIGQEDRLEDFFSSLTTPNNKTDFYIDFIIDLRNLEREYFPLIPLQVLSALSLTLIPCYETLHIKIRAILRDQFGNPIQEAKEDMKVKAWIWLPFIFYSNSKHIFNREYSLNYLSYHLEKLMFSFKKKIK